MSVVITIDGVDRTDKFKLFQLQITNNKRTYNKLRGTLASEEFALEEGVDIQVTIDGNLEFGGLLQSVRNRPTTVLNNYSIYARSYEQITDRRTIGFTYTDEDAGDIVNELITDYLGDENITVGNIDTGASITWSRQASSIKDILNELALTSGYVWFIDNDKKLYFQPDYNFTSGTFPTDYEVVEVGRSLTGYANKVFVQGAGSILAIAEDLTEQAKMDLRYGSGVYGLVIRDQKADTTAKAQDVADKELAKRAFDKKYVKIKTRTRLQEGTYYTGVTIPFTDVSSEDYAIDEVVIECIGDRFTYTATLEPYATSITSKNTAWQEKFREFLNPSNTDTANEVPGQNDVYVQPDEPTDANDNSLWVDTDDNSRYTSPDITLPYVALTTDGEGAHIVGGGTYTALDITTSLAGCADPNGELYQMVHNDDPIGGANIIINSATGDTFNLAATVTVAPQQTALMWGRKGKTDWTVRII